jgi:hypothetical protein
MDEPHSPSADNTSQTETTGPAHRAGHGVCRETLSGDILHGAAEIAAFLYGERKFRRKVFNLVEAKRLPHFRLGAGICAQKSVLLDWIAAQEQGGIANPGLEVSE